MTKPTGKPRGQPQMYTPALAKKIITGLANGKTLRSICKRKGMPSYETVYQWIEKRPDFADAFPRARIVGTHNLADECIAIADSPKGDPLRARLRIDTRLRLIGQWNRSVYGPKQDIEHSGRMTLGELVEASYKRLADTATDITPALTHQPSETLATAPIDVVPSVVSARIPRKVSS